MTPDFPTQTIHVAHLVVGDRVLVYGEIETVLANRGGLVSTDGTGPNSAYMWNENDLVDILSRAAS